MSTRVRSADRPSVPGDRQWIALALVGGLVLAGCWSFWRVSSLEARLLRDGLLFLAVPVGVALVADRPLGWRVDRHAVTAAVGLTALVVPFYVVGSSLPSVRATFPIGGAVAATGGFLPRAALLIGLVVATETFYRGLLCVGIREVGPVAILVSPVVYALQHLGGIPLGLLLAAPADVLFGAADYRTGSILPSVVAHGTGLLLLEWLTMHPPLVSPARLAELLRWLPVPV